MALAQPIHFCFVRLCRPSVKVLPFANPNFVDNVKPRGSLGKNAVGRCDLPGRESRLPQEPRKRFQFISQWGAIIEFSAFRSPRDDKSALLGGSLLWAGRKIQPLG